MNNLNGVPTPQLITIRAGLDTITSEMLKLRLTRAGIYCHLSNATMTRTGRPTMQGISLQVADIDEQQARQILEGQTDHLPEIDQGVLDGEEEATEHCPVCQSDQIEYTVGTDNAIVGSCHACGEAWTI